MASLVRLSCPQEQKDIKVYTNDEQAHLMIVQFTGKTSVDDYFASYRCPSCSNIQFMPIMPNETVDNKLSVVGRLMVVKVALLLIEIPAPEADSALPPICSDEVANFSETLHYADTDTIFSKLLGPPPDTR